VPELVRPGLIIDAHGGQLLEDQREVVYVEVGPQRAGRTRALEQLAEQLGRSLPVRPHVRSRRERSGQRPGERARVGVDGSAHEVGECRPGVAFVGDTTGVRIEGNSFAMPATPPPDIDLEIWDKSFAAILERKPARLFLTHYGYSDNPSEHILLFRERLHRWAALTADILRTSASDSAAMDAFMSATFAEISQHLPGGEAEHYAFSAGLNLSFLGLARYLRKRAEAAASGVP